MNAKRKSSGRISSTRDEAPEIDEKWIAEADLYRGEVLVRRGRPPLENPRQLLSLRLPRDVIECWKASGPGWQTRMAEVLEKKQPRKAASSR
jgi:uncharacterized protein (DUF4415 family)